MLKTYAAVDAWVSLQIYEAVKKRTAYNTRWDHPSLQVDDPRVASGAQFNLRPSMVDSICAVGHVLDSGTGDVSIPRGSQITLSVTINAGLRLVQITEVRVPAFKLNQLNDLPLSEFGPPPFVAVVSCTELYTRAPSKGWRSGMNEDQSSSPLGAKELPTINQADTVNVAEMELLDSAESILSSQQLPNAMEISDFDLDDMMAGLADDVEEWRTGRVGGEGNETIRTRHAFS